MFEKKQSIIFYERIKKKDEGIDISMIIKLLLIYLIYEKGNNG